MDGTASGKRMADTVNSWLQEKRDEIGNIALKVIDACESSLILEANGRSFQLVVPSVFHLAVSDSCQQADADEVFLVTSLDTKLDEAFERTLNGLNEKLERVRIKPTALCEVLDHLLVGLQKFENRKKGAVQNCRNVNPQSSIPKSRAREGAVAHYMSAADDDIGELSKNEDSGFEDFEGNESPDHFGYDLAEGESLIRESNAEFRSKGFLYLLADNAKLQCETAQKNTKGPILLSHTTDVTSSDAILRWCNVNSYPDFLCVQLHVELACMIVDDGAVAALGFSLDSPVKILLEFNKLLWSLSDYSPSMNPLKPDSVLVRQELNTSTTETNTTRKNSNHFDEEAWKLHKLDQTHLYGLEVLLPELVQTYFTFLASKRVIRNGNYDNGDILLELENFATMDNPFVGLLCFIGARFRALPNWCVVCWNTLPYCVWQLRTCNSEFCLFRFEELGLGATVLHVMQNTPELVDFEISLAVVASLSCKDVFEPFPSFLLEREEMRGRSGWFNDKEKGVQHSAWLQTIVQTPQPAQFMRQTWLNRYENSINPNESMNKNLNLLRDLLQSYPPIDEMRHCSDEVALKKTLTQFWSKKMESVRECNKGKMPEQAESSSEWKRKLWLPYDVLRFVLSTNRLSLHLLQDSEKLDFEGTVYQFAVLHDTPEREAHFERRRSDQGGSFFAFHGSAADNWFSILRNGLRCMSNTMYMSSGASYGTGIYLSSCMEISSGYCSMKAPGWSHGLLKDGFSVLSICEVVSGSIRASTGPPNLNLSIRSSYFPTNIIVVPPEFEKDVSIRYILVYKGCIQQLKGQSINGTTLSSKTDLLLHYNHLRSSYFSKQRQGQCSRKESRCKALIASIHNKRDGQDQMTPHFSIDGFEDALATGFARLTEWKGELSPREKRQRITDSDTPAPSASAMQAILKEYHNLFKQMISLEDKKTQKDGEDSPILAGIQVNIPDESNICRWRASLRQDLFKNWPLYKDLTECARHRNVPEVSIELEFIFPATYPFAPPFVRVVSPRFMFHTGHVTVGGSICMELLTESGWSPAFSFESVIVQIVNAMIEGDGRLDKAAWISHTEYNEHEARSAFDRVARAHGWKKN